MKLKNNLRKIMFDKNINSISELQRLMKDAGRPIARRTLDRFYHNENNQIHYDTIIDLCMTLEIDIGELFTIEATEEAKQQSEEG